MIYRKNSLNALAKPAPMINERTILPSSGPRGSQSAITAAPYFVIRVDTTDAALTTATKVVLFDSSEGYQLENSYFMPAALGIEGLGVDYQFLLNDTATNSRFISMIKMTVRNGDGSAAVSGGGQFEQPIQIFQTVVGNGSSQVKRLQPGMGVHEQTYQTHINTFEAGVQISNQIAIVVNVLPDLIVDFAFYQGAEIGRDV